MLLITLSVALAVVGLPSNFLIMFVTCQNSRKLPVADLLVVHLSSGNMLQLMGRILAYCFPLAFSGCFPMHRWCKFATLLLYTSQKVSVWCTLFLSVFRLSRLQEMKKLQISTAQACSRLQVALLLHWVFWGLLYLPFAVLAPEKRLGANVSHCACSLNEALSTEDAIMRYFVVFYGSVTQYMVAVLLCLVNLKIVWILLKHRQSVFAEGAGGRPCHRKQQELRAAQVVAGLVVLFLSCTFINAVLRHFSDTLSAVIASRVLVDTFAFSSPYIIGMGFKSFRGKLQSMFTCFCLSPPNRKLILSITLNERM